MKPNGWRFESSRHSLARKGFKTADLFNTSLRKDSLKRTFRAGTTAGLLSIPIVIGFFSGGLPLAAVMIPIYGVAASIAALVMIKPPENKPIIKSDLSKSMKTQQEITEHTRKIAEEHQAEFEQVVAEFKSGTITKEEAKKAFKAIQDKILDKVRTFAAKHPEATKISLRAGGLAIGLATGFTIFMALPAISIIPLNYLATGAGGLIGSVEAQKIYSSLIDEEKKKEEGG